MQLKSDMYQHERREVQSSMFQAPGTHFLWQQIQTLCLTTGAAPQGFCNRYLLQALPPQRTLPITTLTCNFSHASLLHLGINMVAFWGFGNIVARVRRPHAAAVQARVAGSRPVPRLHAGLTCNSRQVAVTKAGRTLARGRKSC